MLQWYKADGGLKEMSCRVAMLRMQADGLIHLPPPRRAKPALRTISFTNATNPQNPILQPVHCLGPLLLRKVERHESSLWNEYIERYHYLGYTPLPGAQLRYFVMLDQQITALWDLAPRCGRPRHETTISAGPTLFVNAICCWSSIMLAFSFCHGCKSKIWPQRSCPWQRNKSRKTGKNTMRSSRY
jgi:hypothetical protein